MLNTPPNGAMALTALAYVLSWAGKPEEALTLVNRAIRLNPIPPAGYYVTLALALRLNGQYAKSIDVCKKLLRHNPENAPGHTIMTVAYSLLKEYDKAHETAKKVLRINPNYSIDVFKMIAPFKHKSDLDEAVDAFRKAGMREHSPE